MRHLAIIQSEFLKIARDWDDLTYEEQTSYLDRHPQSKRKITAKPDDSSIPAKTKSDQIVYLLVPKKYNSNWQEASDVKGEVTIVPDGESLTEQELDDTQKESDADLVKVSLKEVNKFFKNRKQAERVVKFDEDMPVEQYLLDRQLRNAESKLEKLIELQAPDVIIENTKSMLEDAKNGKLSIKNLEDYKDELIDIVEKVTGRGGRHHLKITTKSGKVFGIFNGKYSTFAADWKKQSSD